MKEDVQIKPFNLTKPLWIIMSKDRRVIATGRTRSRRLTLVSDLGTKKILSYKGKGMAEAAFNGRNWFWDTTGLNINPEDLEAVECRSVLEEIAN